MGILKILVMYFILIAFLFITSMPILEERVFYYNPVVCEVAYDPSASYIANLEDNAGHCAPHLATIGRFKQEYKWALYYNRSFLGDYCDGGIGSKIISPLEFYRLYTAPKWESNCYFVGFEEGYYDGHLYCFEERMFCTLKVIGVQP